MLHQFNGYIPAYRFNDSLATYKPITNIVK